MARTQRVREPPDRVAMTQQGAREGTRQEQQAHRVQEIHQIVLGQEVLVAQRAHQTQVVKQVLVHLPQRVPQVLVLEGVAAQVCELQLKP